MAGTPVAMADGTTKPIEEMEEGDLVLSRDEKDDGTGAITASRVVQTTVREVASTRLVTLSTGEQVETTDEHPFYVSGQGFVPARDLGIGTSIVTRAGPSVAVVDVQVQNTPRAVYNFEVEGTHTYFVGLAGGGVWVHNACPAFDWRRADHIFRTAEGHFNPSTLASQGRIARLLERVAGSEGNLVDGADAVARGLMTQGAADAGVQVFTQTFRNGQQVWVQVRNGIIQNAGVNLSGVLR